MTVAEDLLRRHIETLVADNARWQTMLEDDVVWELPFALAIGRPARVSGRAQVLQFARLAVEREHGISHWAAKKHIGNVLYGVAKAATDKMTADMAHELRPHGVVVVSLYPGLVRTEAVLAAGVFDLSNSESPEFLGRAVAALANDPAAARWSGQVVVSAALAREYGFTDVDGKQPKALTIADV